MANFPERSASHIFSTLNNKDVFNAGDRYNVTKLLDVFLTRALSHSVELEDGKIVVCSVNPGFCRSELAREFPSLVRNIMWGIFAKTTEEGSRNFLWASLQDNIAPGSFASSCEVIRYAHPSVSLLKNITNELLSDHPPLSSLLKELRCRESCGRSSRRFLFPWLLRLREFFKAELEIQD